MADQQQLDLLRQGVKDWNAWRTQHPDIHPELSKANLREADLSRANLSGAELSKAELSRADLYYATLTYATLSEATLEKADLRGANLSEATLIKANLSEAHLNEADLRGANLGKTNLSGANLSEANLRGAGLSRVDLSYADLSRVDLSRVNLSKSDLSYATVGLTIFGDIDLRTVKGLETVHHYDPSTIGADTLLRSGGKIPETFLRKAGLTDAFITSLSSLTPTKYYTCFISHSSKDKEFVESLYADLRARKVQCWYAPESLKIGEQLRHSINESIRSYDKLLVVLSEQSVKSDWVEYEVEAALAKEHRENRTVLFPIRLDNAVIERRTDWTDHILETRYIGDFSHWKESDAYQKGLKRLMHDLQLDRPPPSTS